MPIDVRTLDCGATLLIEPMDGVRSCALCWTLPAGAAVEPTDRLGLAGIVAEMAQRGAGGRTSRQHADALDAAGVSRSLSAGVRTARLSATFVGEDLQRAIPLLADIITRPTLAPDAFGPAQSLALQELDALADDPQHRAGVLAIERHLPQPFGRSSYGTRDGLRSATHADAVDFWSRRYRPGGSIIALAGNVDPDHAHDALSAALEGWQGTADPPASTTPPPRGTAHVHDDGAQVQIVLVRDAPPAGDSRAVYHQLATAVLSGGMSGRLFSEVREKRGLCYAVHAAYTQEQGMGWTTAYVGTTPERADQSQAVLRAELDRIATPQGRPTSDEFERARVGISSRLVFGGESTQARAASIAGDYRKIGRPRTLEERLEEVASATPDGLGAYLETLRAGEETLLTLGPGEAAPTTSEPADTQANARGEGA